FFLFFYLMYFFFFFFFFFQAEDGIRDLIVTGVQTCALPICFAGCDKEARRRLPRVRRWRVRRRSVPARPALVPARAGGENHLRRSEERRVGKECRSRWWPYP